MADAAVSFLWADAAGNEVMLDADGTQPSSFVAGFQPMRFLDGWGIVTPTSDHDFAGMCKALDVEGWDDPRIATVGERIKNREVLSPVMDMVYAMAANVTMEEATVRFERERVPFSMILTPEQLTRDPHAVATGMFVEADHHVAGRTRIPRHPAQFTSTPAALTGGSPALGQHTDEILTELGLGDEIVALREKAVVT